MDTGMIALEMVTCCFCSGSLSEPSAILMMIYPDSDREESQGLYAHRRCLSSRLHPDIPRHPQLLEDDEQQR